jgi:hypothetical protein
MGRYSGNCDAIYSTNLMTLALFSVSPRSDHILFSTKNPPAVQRIPWPSNEEEDENGPGVRRKKWLGHDTWVLNDHDFPWLRAPNGNLRLRRPNRAMANTDTFQSLLIISHTRVLQVLKHGSLLMDEHTSCIFLKICSLVFQT